MLRPEIVKTVFIKELRELLRDRRSLLIMFGVPLLVYPLLIAGVSSIAANKAKSQKVENRTIVVENLDDAPELKRRLELPDSHLTLKAEPPSDAKLQSGDVDAVLTIPPNAETELLSTTGPTSPSAIPSSAQLATQPSTQPSTQPAGPTFTLRVNKARSESDATEDRLNAILADYQKWLTEQRLTRHGIPLSVLSPLDTKVVDIATQDQRLGRFLAQLLPVLLLITGMLGAFFPALNATTTERELGTLETLLVTPVNRSELLFSKGLLVLCCSILTSGLNLISMSLVFLRIVSAAGSSRGGSAFGSVALDPAQLALAFVATIPALILFSAAVMCVGMIARTYREANSFAAPVMMLPMAAMAVGMADPATTKALLATPVANTTILIRDILTHRATFGSFAIATAANLMVAAALLSIAARLFTNEQLVNPSWEPLSLKGFKRGAARKLRWPTIDEALILTALTVLIQFYAGPSIGKLYAAGTLNAPLTVLVIQVVSFLVPLVLFAFIGRYVLRQVFSAFAPKLVAIPGALLAGGGLALVVMTVSRIQSEIFRSAPSDAAKSVAELMGGALEVSPVLAVLCFGIIPGICEELLFRGVVLSAFRKRFNPHAAVWITAFLFALIHMDMADLPMRTLLGAALGYVTLHTGSLLPAMLLHAAFNGTQVGVLAYYDAVFKSPEMAATSRPADYIPEAFQLTAPIFWICTAVGLALALLGAALLRPARQPLPPSSATPTPATPA